MSSCLVVYKISGLGLRTVTQGLGNLRLYLCSDFKPLPCSVCFFSLPLWLFSFRFQCGIVLSFSGYYVNWICFNIFIVDKWPVFVLSEYGTFVCLIFWIGLSVSDKCSNFLS